MPTTVTTLTTVEVNTVLSMVFSVVSLLVSLGNSLLLTTETAFFVVR